MRIVNALLLAALVFALSLVAYDLHQLARMGRAWTVGASIDPDDAVLDPARREQLVQRQMRAMRASDARDEIRAEARDRLQPSRRRAAR